MRDITQVTYLHGRHLQKTVAALMVTQKLLSILFYFICFLLLENGHTKNKRSTS